MINNSITRRASVEQLDKNFEEVLESLDFTKVVFSYNIVMEDLFQYITEKFATLCTTQKKILINIFEKGNLFSSFEYRIKKAIEYSIENHIWEIIKEEVNVVIESFAAKENETKI